MLATVTSLGRVDKQRPYLDIRRDIELEDDKKEYVMVGISYYDYSAYWVVPSMCSFSQCIKLDETFLGYVVKMMNVIENNTQTFELDIVVHDEACMKEIVEWFVGEHADKNPQAAINGREGTLPILSLRAVWKEVEGK
jgi:hypothetical protein